MNSSITYGAIEAALVELGFDITVGPDYRVYRRAPTDTMIVTPDFPLSQAADASRLFLVRKMVVERGVARTDRLERLLSNPPPVPRDVPIKRSSVVITHQLPAEPNAQTTAH